MEEGGEVEEGCGLPSPVCLSCLGGYVCRSITLPDVSALLLTRRLSRLSRSCLSPSRRERKRERELVPFEGQPEPGKSEQREREMVLVAVEVLLALFSLFFRIFFVLFLSRAGRRPFTLASRSQRDNVLFVRYASAAKKVSTRLWQLGKEGR